jgi:hypothetical protein
MDERISMRLILTALLLATLAGCGAEKRLKECAARCQAEEESCGHRREQNCVERGRKCAEECERNGKASF